MPESRVTVHRPATAGQMPTVKDMTIETEIPTSAAALTIVLLPDEPERTAEGRTVPPGQAGQPEE
jgi:hypothetical protein